VELRQQLEAAIAPAGARSSVILIPKREIESWLLYDRNAIARAFRENRLPQIPGNPEALMDPKSHLYELIRRTYRKEYLHTVHNAQIAKNVDITLLRRSRSFLPHFAFVTAVRGDVR